MSKEELKQKAEEYALEKCKECYMCNSEENGERGYCPKLESRKEGYIAGAEPREKQIKIDAEQIIALQKQNGELTDRVRELEKKLEKETAQRIYNFNKSIEWKEKHRELEAQIEKMKSALIDIKSNTDDVNIEWQIKYLFDELEMKEK